MPTATTDTTLNIPAAPSYLPDSMQKKWQTTYSTALKQAQNDYPNSTNQQRSVATKAANAILAVAAPASAADIDKLQEWQVVPDSRKTITQTVKGVQVQLRVCVTADGKKYSFPVVPGDGKK